MGFASFMADLGAFGATGFLRAREIAWQVRDYKETGTFTGSACATDFVQREALIQQIIEAEKERE